MNTHIDFSSTTTTNGFGRMQHLRYWLVGAVAALAVFTGGCSEGGTAAADGVPETEPIDSVQAEISETECDEVAADQEFYDKIDPPFVTPQAYDTCNKGYVVDVNVLSPEYAGGGTFSDSKFTVKWADAPVTTPNRCELTRITAIFYESAQGLASSTGQFLDWYPVKSETRYGVWTDACGGSCVLDVSMNLPEPGKTYRIAVSGRSDHQRTRKVSIGTYKPVTQ